MSITWKTAAVRPLVGVVAGVVALTGCATAEGGSSKSDEVSVVGFSVLKTANEQVLKRLPEDRRRQGRHLQDVLRRVG